MGTGHFPTICTIVCLIHLVHLYLEGMHVAKKGTPNHINQNIPPLRCHANKTPSLEATGTLGVPAKTQGVTVEKFFHRSVGVHHPNSRSHAKAWESISPIQHATPMHLRSRYPQRLAQGQNQNWLLNSCRLGGPKVGNGYITHAVSGIPIGECWRRNQKWLLNPCHDAGP